MKNKKMSNVFLLNQKNSESVYNPITNKMVRRNSKTGKMLTSQYKFIFSGGTNIPFIANENYWKVTPNGDPVYSCSKECFPYDISSHLPCLPRCLYTDGKGYDPYTKFDDFFKHPIYDEKKKHKQKTIIITFGPPSSGKGSLGDFFKHHLDIDVQDLVDVNVDFIFQNKQYEIGKEYQTQVENIKTTYPADKHKLYIQRLYSYYRWVADQVSDLILTTAINENYSIKWETSGGVNMNYLKSWINHKIKQEYHVVVVYPYVEQSNLITRIRKREQNTQQTGAPEEKIINMISTSVYKFDQLKKTFDKEPNVRLLQIDNNTLVTDESKRKIMYDSKASSNFSFCVIS